MFSEARLPSVRPHAAAGHGDAVGVDRGNVVVRMPCVGFGLLTANCAAVIAAGADVNRSAR
jgi:hypothetical protein